MTKPLTPSPLNILILNSARRWIGEAAHSVTLARALLDQGHNVQLGLRRDFDVDARARQEGLPVISLGFSSRFNPIGDWRDMRAIQKVCREKNIDIIHANRGKDHWAAAAACLLMRQAPPLVRSRHVVVPSHTHIANRWLFKHATQGILSVSKAARASLGPLASYFHDSPPDDQQLKDPDSLDRVILSAVDSDLFNPDKRDTELRRELTGGRDPEKTILIGMIGRMQRIKGQREFLTSAAQVAKKHPETHFILAGRNGNSHRPALLKFAEENGLDPDKVTILDMVDNLPQIMASLDIGAVSSLGSEGSSRISLEYMASQLPIVATTVGGIPELLHEEETAYLVAPADIPAMSARLIDLIESPEKRRKMGQKGRKAVEKNHSILAWVQQVETFYRTVIVHNA